MMLKLTSRSKLSLLILLALWCMAPLSFANQAMAELKVSLPADITPTVFIENSSKETVFINEQSPIVSASWMDAQGGDFERFVRIEVSAAGENSWDATLRSLANTQAIKKGDWVYASYYARASEGTNTANIRGFIERSVPSWMMVSDASVAPSGHWTRVVAVGRAPENLAEGSTYVSLHLAAKAQTLDIANLIYLSLPGEVEASVFPVTQLTYAGMELDAPWRNKAKEMIKTHRQSTHKLFVLDRQGQAVSNAKVDISMIDVDYELGSMATELLVEDSELGEQYRLWFDQFFNYATATIYWADWGWENPRVREVYLNKMAYFKEQGIDMRGHVLLYPAFRFSPKVLIDLQDDKEAFIARVNQQIDEMVPILKAHGMQEYDVINELRAEKEWLDIVGIDTVVQWYKRVHALHPDAILYINENSILTDGGDNEGQKDHYFNLITELLEKGAPIHGIGMQGHFNGIVTPIEKMWDILDRFSSFNLPIRITEYDSDTRDTSGQASFDTDFYEAMYAHPATVGVTRWGFYEPVMWRPAGALINPNNEFKPNALAYLNWLEALRDNQQALKTNKKGVTEFTGLYGKYAVSVKGQEFVCEYEQMPIGHDALTEGQSCTVRLE
ncbi:endo-1,4-beta-xylanase [Glaciecola siphonariae]|uniref:endo-1,4-beta-xylanase n=1 Tax=Glaciecola siphonariae TaxID=521012 RepID=A0ABV9M239_9ALTE